MRTYNSRNAVWIVTFKVYSFIPIVKRICAFLDFNCFEPRIFSGRLIKVTMDCQIVDAFIFLIVHNLTLKFFPVNILQYFFITIQS